MKYDLHFLPEIEEDVIAGYSWYEEKARGLGEEFLRMFYACANEITRNPLLYRGQLRERLSQPRVQEDLGRIQVKSVPEILAHFVFGAQEVPAFVTNAPINTDDNALLEFSAPKTLYIDTSEANFKELSQYSRGATIYLRH